MEKKIEQQEYANILLKKSKDGWDINQEPDVVFLDNIGAKNLYSALGELLNIPDEIARLKELLISEKRKQYTKEAIKYHLDKYNLGEDSYTIELELESFKKIHNL